MLSIQFVLGLIVMQLIFLLMYLVILKRIEILYYLLSIGFISIFVISIIFSSDRKYFTLLGFTYSLPVVFIFLLLGGFLHFRFLRFFTGADASYPFLGKVLKTYEYIFIIVSLFIGIELALTHHTYYMEKIAKLVFFTNYVAYIYVILFLIRTREIHFIVVMVGSLILGITIKLSLSKYIYTGEYNGILKSDNYLIWGLVLNFILLDLSLIFKSRMIEKKNSILELEKQKMIFQNRIDLSNDLHDEVGTMLSSIQLYAELSSKLITGEVEQAKLQLNKITETAKKVVGVMNDVIWSMNNERFQKNTFIGRIKDFYADLQDVREIECEFDVDPSIDQNITRILARKNLLLIAKESFNNIMKHSQASQIRLSLKYSSTDILLRIEDNGIGIKEEQLSKGNGFFSIRKRVDQLNGKLKIGSSSFFGKGTMVECFFPIANIRD